MDTYGHALACVLLGGVLGVIIPYLTKVVDKEIKFSYSYFYALCVSMVVAAVAMVPTSIDEMTIRVVTMLILAGFGIQTSANMITTRIRKSVECDE